MNVCVSKIRKLPYLERLSFIKKIDNFHTEAILLVNEYPNRLHDELEKIVAEKLCHSMFPNLSLEKLLLNKSINPFNIIQEILNYNNAKLDVNNWNFNHNINYICFYLLKSKRTDEYAIDTFNCIIKHYTEIIRDTGRMPNLAFNTIVMIVEWKKLYLLDIVDLVKEIIINITNDDAKHILSCIKQNIKNPQLLKHIIECEEVEDILC